MNKVRVDSATETVILSCDHFPCKCNLTRVVNGKTTYLVQSTLNVNIMNDLKNVKF